MAGSSSSGSSFNPASLNAAIPSVANGPFNVAGAQQNAATLAQQYPWITPPAGAFAGAAPGQSQQSGAFSLGLAPASGAMPAAAPPGAAGPPVGGSPASLNPIQAAGGAPNSFTPTSMQAILAALTGSGPRSA
jgi:hypothetical protein